MRNQFNEIMQKLRAQRVRARRYTAMLLVLAMLTSLSVSWRLHQVGTALTTDNEYCCGMEEHVHTDDCYTEELVCGYEEGQPEEPDSAFSVDSEPTTEGPEAEPEVLEPEETEPEVHHHTADCYETVLVEHKELTCGQEEHTHDETCPIDPDTGDFTCGFEEHTHTDDCFTTETETEEKLVCGYEEGQVLSDGTAADDDGIAALEDTNTATSVAEDNSSEAVSEPVLHHHTEACYEKVLTCTIPEHTHTLACLADYSADVETDDDWQKYSVGLSDHWNEALLAVAKEQLGYKESEKNFQTDEALGDIIDIHHYTRYGAFYGNPYADWDVAFIAFCQHYAGIPKTEIPQRLGLEALRADMDAMGFAYLTEGEDAAYEAIPGDVVTYNKNGTADDETIGIVETVGDDSLTVISGAVEGAVAEVTVPFTDVTSTILVDQAYGDYVGEADDRDGSHDDEIAVQPADEMVRAVAQTSKEKKLDWNIVTLNPEKDGTITYDQKSDTFKTKLEMNFRIPQGQINPDTLYYWEFPDSVTIPYDELSENFSPMFESKDSPVKAGEYRLRQMDDRKYRVEFKVDPDYYKNHTSGDYVGNVEYEGKLKATGTDDKGNTIVKGDTGFKVTLEGTIKYPPTTNKTDKYDLTTKKEGEYDAAEGKLNYTVTITSHRGTPGVVEFVDEIYDAKKNTLHLGEPTVTVEEYQFTEKRDSDTSTEWKQEGAEQKIGDVTPTDREFAPSTPDGKAKLTMTLPWMKTEYKSDTERVCKRYKVTYSYDVKNLGNVDYKFHNDVTASSQKDNTPTIEDKSSENVEVKNSYQISKSKTLKEENGKTKVTWTIKVNENRQNIFGAKVTDSMTIGTNSAQYGLAQAVDEIKVTPNSGYHFIDKDGKETTNPSQYAGIKFDKADDQTDEVNTNQYTIVYTTEHDLGKGKYTVANKAQFVKPDGSDGPTDGAKADIAGRGGYKEYDAVKGITENADNTISIPWKARVDVSKVKTISEGTVLKDMIMDSGHVMTGKQAKDWGGVFTWTDSSEKPVETENGSFTDSEYYELGFYTDKNYNQTKPLRDLQDDDEIYGYQIRLVKDVTAPVNADRMLIKYYTTGKSEVNKENSYRNRFYINELFWKAVYKYTPATITKTDGNGKTGTTTINNETGEVTWKIVVRTDTLKLHEKVTVVDTLPTGIEAESVQILFGTSGSLLLNVPADGKEASTGYNNDTFRVRRDGQKLTMSLENPDGKIMQNNNTTFIIKGRIVLKSDGSPIEEEVKNSYTNIASVSFDGGASITSNPQTQEWTKKKEETPEKEVLKKVHLWDARSQLMNYTVDINPDAKEFFAEEKDANGNPIKYDYLTLEDTFTLAKHPDQVGGTPKNTTAENINPTKVDIKALLTDTKLYYARTDADGKPVFGTDGKLVLGEEVKGWTLKTRVDSSDNGCNKYLMTIENVPNKTPLVLKYAYQISSNLLEVYPKTEYDYTGSNIDIHNVSNNIELSGTGIVESTGNISTSWSSSSSGATLSSGNSVTIVKIEEGAENMKLAGAKFQLQKYDTTTSKYENAKTLHTKQSEFTTIKDYGQIQVAESVTEKDASGNDVVYDELEKDVLYRLIEVEAPAGYEPPTETERIANAVYFYSSSGGGATIDGPKEDVAKAADLAKGSKTVTITNKPNQTELTVRKVWEDENGNATTPGANSVTLQLYRAEYDRPPYTSAVGCVAANITPKGNGRFTNKDDLTQQIADELTNLPEGSTFDVVVTVITGGVQPEHERTDRDAIYWNNTKCLTTPDEPELYNGNSSKTTYTYHLTMKKGVNILGGVIDTSNAADSGAWNTDFTVEIKNVNKAEAATKRNEKAFESAGTTDANGVFTLTSGDNWMKTFENLPLTGTDGAKVIYYGYSVREVKVGEFDVVDNRAGGWIVSNGGDGYTSGTIIVRNHKPSNPPDTPDTPGYELPATGSTGTAPYTTAGAVLMGAALVGGYRRKRRQERRGE